MKKISRKIGLKAGLEQLNLEQLKKILEYKNEFCLDTYNYHEGKFCPLAVAFDLENIDNPSHEKIQEILLNKGLKIYNTRGIPGDFYRENRYKDLIEATKEVINEKLYVKENMKLC